MRRAMILGVCAIGVASAACTEKKTETAPPPAATAVAPVTPPPPPGPDAKALAERAKAIFGTPQPTHTTEDATVESARVELGRMLYYDKRLSKNQDLSCNSCHDLAGYGVDVREKDGQRTATSEGHKGQFGGRNSPTSYNAFFHVAQFWDGRAKDVEEQAMGPMLNPVEMAMKDAKAVEKVLKSIPDYGPKFKAAFPEEKGAITQVNAARAIAAFERKLVTPAPIDAFLAGNTDALTTAQLKGLELFMERCVACHMGPGFGGAIYQKLGLIKPYPIKDEGRFEATKNEADKGFFKVPSLRNIAKTGPYFHDGSLGTLKEAVSIMAEHQTAQGALSDAQMADMLAFLDSLTGEVPTAFIAEPALPASSKKTPKPDPS